MAILGSRRTHGDETLYARAMPQKVELTEIYSVEQEISRNPVMQQVGDGTGLIEVSVPYDGQRYFTRQAVTDVERVLGPRGGHSGRRATIGHLLLTDYTKADGLRAVVRPHNQTGLIPLSVPASTVDGSLDLTGDRHTCVVTYDYRPDNPTVYPIDLSVELDDMDSLTEDIATVQTLVAQGRQNPSWVIEKLRQKSSFSSMLLVSLVVRIAIPIKEGYPLLAPVVKDMSIQWPTLTSLRSTRLTIEDGGPAAVRYNPVKSRLEWKDVPMDVVLLDRPEKGTVTRVFVGKAAWLGIGHPGELFRADQLEVNARVEIPSYLMSGLEARLYDATGRRQDTQPKLTTILNIRTHVYPADVFAGRAFSPYQQFVFDDIIPDEMRITDIITVLRNARFEVEEFQPDAQSDPLAPTWLLLARRSQGPDDLDLLVAVEGKRTTLDRQQIMGASVKISGTSDSGQLKVSVLGTLPRDHKELTREMNALQQQVRNRFRPHQTSKVTGS